jgi:hypothetical protein
LILALSSIVARRKSKALEAEVAGLRKDMDRLRGDVTTLSHAEQRRFMRELNKQSGDVPSSGRDFSPKGNDTDPNLPAKKASDILRFEHWLRTIGTKAPVASEQRSEHRKPSH